MVRPRVARGMVKIESAVLHQCIRPLIGARCSGPSWICARSRSDKSPCLDRQRVPTGFGCAGKTVFPSLPFSRRPRRELGFAALRHRCAFSVPFLCSCHKGRSFVPTCRSCGAPRAGAVKTGRSRGHPAGLGLDSPEHGATLMQVGTPSRASSRIRTRVPC